MNNNPAAEDGNSHLITMIDVEKLSVSVGKKNLVTDVSFQIRKGSITGLVGENGAGKSTLIKSILDFSSPNTGTITINGVMHRHKSARSVLAYLPEQFSPPYYLNGQEYINYCAKLYGVTYPTATEMSAQLALPEDAFLRPVKTLSKGMTQKLGLLAALNSQRDLLLLDEPMSGLDPRARFLLRQLLANQQKRGATILFTTHMLNDIQELADHMLLMHHGKLRYNGSPQDLVQQTGSNSLETAFLTKTA